MGCADEADLDHALADADTGGDSLFGYIDMTKVWARNETTEGSASGALKPWHKRQEPVPFVLSADEDPELIIHVPFKQDVMIRSIAFGCAGEGEGSPPSVVRLFANRETLDFELGHSLEPSQTLETVVADATGDVDHPLRPDRFRSCSSVTLFVTDSVDGDGSRLTYVGFKGKSVGAKRQPVSAVYELVGAPTETSDPLAVPKFVS